MRLFFAVPLPDDLIRRVLEVQDELRSRVKDEGVKWTKPEQFHFTIKFLGETPGEKLDRVRLVGDAARQGRAPFALRLAGIGAFPNPRRPSTLWLGTKEGSDSLASLALQLDELLVKCGYRKENRPLAPHLTLARIKSYSGEAEVAKLLQTLVQPEIGSMAVDHFLLMQSILRPAGSQYSVIGQFGFVS